MSNAQQLTLSDEEHAKKLQEELDREDAGHVQQNQHNAVSDFELAKRLQEEADVEAEFERATMQYQQAQQAANGKVH
eukprot:CAMPEP_0202919960 /NCGR_PEP_ID=MMETSP1392-20130828/76596_1 /ASSEMBLY_ACC=CAM_ASM_000868 /TAXON_ID=225041 /ORGANISM="Chlamydomonas chlamydogama, Strain SAG 11-48b" /LENGTH=76 /DNA_ID=CAMNT_0049613429 /DNA_START=105 /DNA_END=335 /DNA_ORIENTATION=-